jgi:hypothetical protein
MGECNPLFNPSRPLCNTSAPFIRNKALGQSFRIRQRDEMATGNFLNLLCEPFTRNTPLKFYWEKAIVSSRKNTKGNVRPALEATGLCENGLGFLARLLRAGAQHVPRHVVQKVRFHIELRRVTAPRLVPALQQLLLRPTMHQRSRRALGSSH